MILNTLPNQVRKMDDGSTTEINLLVNGSTGILGSYVLTVVVGVVEIKQNKFV